MIQTLIQNRWLLAFCGVLNAVISAIYLIMYDAGPHSSLTLHGWTGTVVFLSRLSVAAGLSTIAAGLWNSANGKSWLLVLNGLAMSAYGLIPILWKGPLGFNLFALLIVGMAVTLGLLALTIARTRHAADQWLFGSTGAASIAFALVFVALVNRWIQLERRPFHPSIFLWLCFYFAFTAFCMIALALRLHSAGSSESGPHQALPPLGDPKLAH
jgi:hypothetical protein